MPPLYPSWSVTYTRIRRKPWRAFCSLLPTDNRRNEDPVSDGRSRSRFGCKTGCKWHDSTPWAVKLPTAFICTFQFSGLRIQHSLFLFRLARNAFVFLLIPVERTEQVENAGERKGREIPVVPSSLFIRQHSTFSYLGQKAELASTSRETTGLSAEVKKPNLKCTQFPTKTKEPNVSLFLSC